MPLNEARWEAASFHPSLAAGIERLENPMSWGSSSCLGCAVGTAVVETDVAFK